MRLLPYMLSSQLPTPRHLQSVQPAASSSCAAALTLPSASSLSTSVHAPCIWNWVMSSVIRLQA